jgi:aminoglycoside phosphotransferase (APT) family kinase protein
VNDFVGFYAPPPTDRALTADAVRDVVRAQFPELAVDTLERLGDGWEHEVYLVDGRVAFRFPRYADVGRGFAFEERRLALVASVVGDVVGIPRITRWGRPSVRFPHPFAGHALIPGVAASDPDVPLAPLLADDLGRVLARVHAIPAAASAAAGIDVSVVQRTDLPVAREQIRRWVREVPESARLAPAPCAWLEDAPAPPRAYDGPPRFLHDDLQMEHIIVDRATGRLSGIIDWGGAFGDPARDFSYVLLHGGWSFFERSVRAYDLALDEAFAERTLFSARLGAIAWLADALKRGASTSRELAIVRRVFELT